MTSTKLSKILITGSSGLIGSEVVEFFGQREFQVVGVDNNQRAIFFGPGGDTRWNQKRLQKKLPHFEHVELDIRNREAVLTLIEKEKPSLLVHTAAQPSHDLAAKIPFDDFDVNAVGTLNLLEAVRRHSPETVFVHMSTNKVYGDRPNTIKLRELEARWDFDDEEFAGGISESFPIDQSKHSLFGASKVAADIMVQEYGRYFGLRTCCLRGGCLTGPYHSGVQLHGFLNYLVQCHFTNKGYTIFGYGGKQVRDNIHSMDVARFIWEFWQNPRCGEVYNIGGGKGNSCSIWEALELIQGISGKTIETTYEEKAREGDHICYYSDLRKMKKHYPTWDITKSLPEIITEIVAMCEQRQGVTDSA